MTNTVINAITQTLHSIFGDDYHYYKEEINQNIEYPCFVVQPLEPSVRSTNRYRYIQTIPLVIYYFGEKNDSSNHEKCYDISSTLWHKLEYLPLDDDTLIRGYNVSWEINEGVLQFYITYRIVMIGDMPDTTDMEILKTTQKTKY